MNTILYPLLGTLFTFLMTTLGSALVFFFKDEIKDFYQQLFLGFAAGKWRNHDRNERTKGSETPL